MTPFLILKYLPLWYIQRVPRNPVASLGARAFHEPTPLHEEQAGNDDTSDSSVQSREPIRTERVS